MSNPHTISWVNPTTFTDGSAYAQTDNAGYTLQIDGVGAVSIPLAFGTSFDLSTLAAYQALKKGTHTVALAAVAAAASGGQTSAFSNVSTFQISVPPSAPTSLAIA